MSKFLQKSLLTLTGSRTLSGLVFLMSFSAQFAFSQGAVKPVEHEYLKLNGKYLFSYLTDARDVAIAPLRWNKYQWIGFSGFLGGTALMYTQDEPITDFFQRQRTETKDKVTKYVFDPLGTWYLIPIFGSVYIYGLAAKNPEAETAALMAGKAIIISGAYAFVFKEIFQRKRPYDADPPDAGYWGGPGNGFHYNSFPSGHATVAFAAASAISTYYSDRIWIGITSYSLASLVGVSRIYDNKHWASDVMAGAVLGYAIGRMVANKQKKQSWFGLAPYYNGWASGITLSYDLK
jgi:membrane-associated phospholipid phosphatase